MGSIINDALQSQISGINNIIRDKAVGTPILSQTVLMAARIESQINNFKRLDLKQEERLQIVRMSMHLTLLMLISITEWRR